MRRALLLAAVILLGGCKEMGSVKADSGFIPAQPTLGFDAGTK